MMLLGAILAWIPFIHPLRLPPGGRLWTFLPLALCVAMVYRATRTSDPSKLARSTAFTFLNIVFGMCVIALAAYGLHEAIIRMY